MTFFDFWVNYMMFIPMLQCYSRYCFCLSFPLSFFFWFALAHTHTQCANVNTVVCNGHSCKPKLESSDLTSAAINHMSNTVSAIIKPPPLRSSLITWALKERNGAVILEKHFHPLHCNFKFLPLPAFTWSSATFVFSAFHCLWLSLAVYTCRK